MTANISKQQRRYGVFIGAVIFFFVVNAVMTSRDENVRLGLMATPKRSALMAYEHFHVHRKDDRSVQKIALIGERNSGTTWMSEHLQLCFNHSIDVQHKLVRYKHFFQDDVLPKKRIYDTLVVAMFRNPYYWVKAMQEKSWHSPMHYKRDWKEFLTMPWTMERSQADIELLKNSGGDPSKIQCQEGYNYTRINACIRKPFTNKEYAELFKRIEIENITEGKYRWSSHQPQYELRPDGSGKPYDSILELRRDKIYNTLEIAQWDWIKEVLTVQYEELVSKGTAALIAYIEGVTGVPAKCEVSPGQDRPQRPLEPDFVKYMKEHVDWEAEELIGYTKFVPGEGETADK